jgi:hypothetical protein
LGKFRRSRGQFFFSRFHNKIAHTAQSEMSGGGGGWEKVDGGGWVRRRHRRRCDVDARLAKALLAGRVYFHNRRSVSGGGASASDVVVVSSARLRRAAVAAWRAWGLTAARGARRRAEETCVLAGTRGVDFECFARALRTVVRRHVSFAKFATAKMIHCEGDDARGALRAYRAALGGTSSMGEEERGEVLAWWAPAEALLRAARLTKQLARGAKDIGTAEMLLRAATTAGAGAGAASASASASASAGAADESRRAAASDLGMHLCQEGRDAEAATVLTTAGFRYRLARDVLRYPVKNEDNAGSGGGGGVGGGVTPGVRYGQTVSGNGAVAEWEDVVKETEEEAGDKGGGGVVTKKAAAVVTKKAAAMAAHRQYVRAFDGAMPATALRHLRAVFGATSPFWIQHGYHRAGCGFFSYVHALRADAKEDRRGDAKELQGDTKELRGDVGLGGGGGGGGKREVPGSIPGGGGDCSGDEHESTMDAVVRRVWKIAQHAFPAAKDATRAEWWAHCRPHSSGHQMHFDSDDEGLGWGCTCRVFISVHHNYNSSPHWCCTCYTALRDGAVQVESS